MLKPLDALLKTVEEGWGDAVFKYAPQNQMLMFEYGDAHDPQQQLADMLEDLRKLPADIAKAAAEPNPIIANADRAMAAERTINEAVHKRQKLVLRKSKRLQEKKKKEEPKEVSGFDFPFIESR